jgi:glycosyltransferase involved in cell wall biosynthesis
VVLKPQARHPILFKIWFNVSVKKALEKYKADLFFSPDGYLSLTTKVKQIGVIHDINFEHNPSDLKPVMRKYYQKFFPQFAEKAEHILTVSEYSKKDICNTYGLPESKVTAVWNGASNVFRPRSEADNLLTRKKYTNEHPYFLFVGALHPRKNVNRLIEAFEQFKIETESQHQLVIVGTELWSNAGITVNVDEKIKKQIHFTGHLDLEELAKVMAAAEIFTFVPYFEGFGIPLVEAMKCGTPIISGDRTSLPEVAGDAALYCDPFDVDEISSRMKTLALDPELQKDLSAKGLERAKSFSWDATAEKVWAVLESALFVK